MLLFICFNSKVWEVVHYFLVGLQSVANVGHEGGMRWYRILNPKIQGEPQSRWISETINMAIIIQLPKSFKLKARKLA